MISPGFLSLVDRLSCKPAAKSKLIAASKKAAARVPPSETTQRLLKLWGKPIYGKLGVRPPKWEGKRIAFIHWLPCGNALQPIEIFHLNMLWAFDAADFFEEVHIRVAGDGSVPAYVASVAEEVLGHGKARLDIKGIENSETWEWDTYNEFLDAARPDADLYYMHFKGTSHIPGSVRNKNRVFSDYGNFAGLTFWSYLMYQALFTIRPTPEKPAVCGILHENPAWTEKIGWDIRPYHASGSFQGYRGEALVSQRDNIEKMLARARKDQKYMRYTVEGMMTFLFGEESIARLADTLRSNVSMYADLPKAFPAWHDEFCKGPEYLICRR